MEILATSQVLQVEYISVCTLSSKSLSATLAPVKEIAQALALRECKHVPKESSGFCKHWDDKNGLGLTTQTQGFTCLRAPYQSMVLTQQRSRQMMSNATQKANKKFTSCIVFLSDHVMLSVAVHLLTNSISHLGEITNRMEGGSSFHVCARPCPTAPDLTEKQYLKQPKARTSGVKKVSKQSKEDPVALCGNTICPSPTPCRMPWGPERAMTPK